MEGLSPDFFKLFKENKNLFYSQIFLEGISYEYGLFDKSKDINKAFECYQNGADFKYDYLCMYRMHRIFLTDYDEFGLKRNQDLDRLYLYKCFAYLPFLIINKIYFLFNKSDIIDEIWNILEKTENSNSAIFDEFMDFLSDYKDQFHLSNNDIKLMRCVIKNKFCSDSIKEKIGILDEFLNFEKGDTAYYEAQLKYCNFYLNSSGDKYDKIKIKNIFDNLIRMEYYKAYYDYGRFLQEEGKYDEAKNIFKKGLDNS